VYIECKSLSYAIVEEFCRRDNEMIKVAELKKVEQESKTMEKFIQELRKAAKGSVYEKRLLIEEFKRVINEVITRKLMKVKRPPRNINQ